MMIIKWTKGARTDLVDIFTYIAEDSLSAARKLRAKLKRSVSELHKHPAIGRVVPEFGNAAIRERIVVPYRVIYLVQGKMVFILGILHGHRQLTDEVIQ
jgi:toxin ParE1/3/4